MTPFTARVVRVIQAIPEGKVMTYGQIAACAGSPRAARQVVRLLHSMSGPHQLPWHRVVNKQGEIALKEDESKSLQMLLLESEGVELLPGNRVDLAVYQWDMEQACEEG
ncbi:methylated-DNA--[protein]-cysteine S-methyltransferase [Paenibacillus sp. YPG26]|uniref:MGMT family protein n=1 Tax=Paenibacillus sp. YPG26 TaxID=2878915 RepID=UPI00203CB5A7|nr:methylated-DNA--[protein]-cysteine S-methyltransferase [Paenibacillus sp. YPG26]USB35156.1 methylated-DNA--[protein]-cysteine S-methyltransferase [Paenibacillus sp. YPG26]